jgi:hypothetical protein
VNSSLYVIFLLLLSAAADYMNDSGERVQLDRS